MDKEFYLGIMLGMLGGALLSANSIKVRKAVKDGQEQLMTAINNLEKKNHTEQPAQE